MKIEEITRMDRRVMLIEEAKRKMISDFVAEHHPHKINDVIPCNDFNHPGKTMQVSISYMNLHRQPGGEIYAYSFHCKGRIINKTGFPGLNTSEWRGMTISIKPLENKIAQADNG